MRQKGRGKDLVHAVLENVHLSKDEREEECVLLGLQSGSTRWINTPWSNRQPAIDVTMFGFFRILAVACVRIKLYLLFS